MLDLAIPAVERKDLKDRISICKGEDSSAN